MDRYYEKRADESEILRYRRKRRGATNRSTLTYKLSEVPGFKRARIILR